MLRSEDVASARWWEAHRYCASWNVLPVAAFTRAVTSPHLLSLPKQYAGPFEPLWKPHCSSNLWERQVRNTATMERVCSCGVLLPFLIGFGGPTTYLLFAMGYQLYYDFDNVISRKGGAANVFTSISRATAKQPWTAGWIVAMSIHLVFNWFIKDDFTSFWSARQKLLPPEERDVYLDLASIFLSDLFYLRTVDFLEAKLARCKDSTAVYLRFHHHTANRAMKALAVGIAVSLALHILAAVSYAHSAFGFLELLYGCCHGWHELVTSAIVVAGGRELRPEHSEHEAADGAGPREAPQGVLRSRRLQGLPPEFQPLR
ncbi:hypothetical protein MTO96_022999 [Rhipicephalus appendiculatus]